MRKVIISATAAVALVIAGHGHAMGAKASTRAPSTTTRPAGTPPARRVHQPTTHRSNPTSTTRRQPTTTTAVPAATSTTVTTAPLVTTTVGHHSLPAGPTTTTTTTPAQRQAKRALLLQACLELAASNNFRVKTANQAWYRQQLHRITAKGPRGVALRNVLLVDENQTQSLIDAQYTIDQSNCYIKYA